MSLDVGRCFRNGLRELYSPRGVVIGLLLLCIGITNLYVNQSIQLHIQQWIFGLFPETGEQQQLMAEASTALPFALEIGIAVLLAATVAFVFVEELFRLVGIRMFASESDEPIPFDDVTENLGPAVMKILVLGGTFSLFLLVVNFIPLLGQLISWVLVLVFVYLRQVIALEDLGFVETIKLSFEVFVEEPLPIALILLVLGVFGVVASAGVPFALNFFVFPNAGGAASQSILQNPQALTLLLGVTLGALFQVLGIATVTDAYKQVRTDLEESTD